MDDIRKKDESYDRGDRPAVRFETVVEAPEEAVVPEQHQSLELPHQLPPEMPREVVEEKTQEEVQGSRFDELARALGGGAVEAGSTINNRRTGRKLSWGWLGFLLIFIFGSGLGMAGGYVMWGKQFEIRNQPTSNTGDDMPLFTQNTPKATTTPAVVTSTPKVGTERGQVALQVLNGSGTVGAASDIKDFLEGLGYKGVAVGNANRSDYDETKISVKDTKKALLQMLAADLGKKVSVSTAASTLSETSSYDAIVTLGRK